MGQSCNFTWNLAVSDIKSRKCESNGIPNRTL